MIKINRQKKRCFLLVLTLSIFLIKFASSWGVSSSYWPESPLVLEPGESREVFLTLQNMVEDRNVLVRAELIGGKEIAALIDENLDYELPYGRKDIVVRIKVNMPEDAKRGEKYGISVAFKEVSQQEGRMLELSGSVVQSIPLLVAGEKEEVTPTQLAPETESFDYSSLLIILAILIVIIASIMVYLVLRKKNKSNNF